MKRAFGPISSIVLAHTLAAAPSRSPNSVAAPHGKWRRRSTAIAKLAALLLVTAFLSTCQSNSRSSSGPQSPPSSSYADQFDFLWQTFDQNYSYFVYKNIDWTALSNTYRPQAIQATSQQQFMQVMGQMLSNLHDMHVYFTDPNGNGIPTFTPTTFINFNSTVWAEYMQAQGTELQQNSYFTAGWLGGVAYISINSWQPSSGPETTQLDQALEQFQNAPALIVDVRMNPGGDSTTAGNFAGRFADQTRTAGFVQFRNGPAHTDFGALETRQVVPRGPWQFHAPVLLLIGRGCVSSNEDFITQMRELRNVTVAGDTSAGHSGDPASYNLSGGWKFTVSTWIDYTAEMQIIEDKGIDPAIFVPATAADFQAGKDPVLDFAIKYFSK
jgi:C-terminal processing protease CtpA/Prc